MKGYNDFIIKVSHVFNQTFKTENGVELHADSRLSQDRLANRIAVVEEVPLAIELRNSEWFSDEEIFNKICDLFEENNITNIIVDTAGRRDMLHMRLTTPVAFIRYVGANAESDYQRLEDWLERLTKWKNEGLKDVFFFVHQNLEKASPLLSAHFIKEMNEKWDTKIHVPEMADTKTLF